MRRSLKCALFVIVRNEGNMGILAVGSEAPAFTLPNQDGELVSLADYSGKNVLLWWYPRADTPG